MEKQSFINKKIILTVLTVIIIGVGYYIATYVTRNNNMHKVNSGQASTKNAPEIGVNAVTLKEINIPIQIHASGQVLAVHYSKITSEISGKIS